MDQTAPAKAYLRLASATFSDKTVLQFLPGDVIVFVGPNNVGKSAALRNTLTLLEDNDQNTEVIKNLKHETGGSDDVIIRLVESVAQKEAASHDNLSFYYVFNTRVRKDQILRTWQKLETSGLGMLSKLFCCHLSAENRLKAANTIQAIAINKESKRHPLHFIYDDEELELKLSADFRAAFHQDLILDRTAGNEWPLLAGEAPPLDLRPGRRAFPKEYQKALQALPRLEKQGDGMRSFVGVLLEATVSEYSIVLIDEPEAFLHPPQARLLSRMLGQKKKEDSQLFIATHSADVLRGLLDAIPSKLSIVRLRRKDNVNQVYQLTTESVKAFWSDPLLRYSNVLDGLFHEEVVICEGDADCRFYEAIAVAVAEKEGRTPPDALFVHCGGKQRIATLVKALRAVGVPVSVVADFDILSEEGPLRRTFEALGREWSEISGDWTAVKVAIDSKKPELEAADVDDKVRKVLSNVSEKYFPSEATSKIQKILRRTTPWSFAKDQGKTYVPPGQATQTCDRLLKSCRAGGLFVVEVGELESFVRSVGGHGPAWVNAVLEGKDLADDPELETARDFVKGFLPSSMSQSGQSD